MVRQWRGKPSVYLDHCAFRRISETPERAKAFRDALIARNGSLAVSMLNFVEFAQVTDPRQLAAGEQLIDSILPRIYIQNPSYPHVIDAERKKRSPAGFPGNPDSDGNMLYHFTTPARMYGFPLTVLLAAILGGPLAGGYLISRDHSLFGSPKKAMAALLWSFVVFLGTIGLGYALPEHSSGTIPAAIVAGLYRWYAKEAFQGAITQRQQQGWLRYSWWRVLGLSVEFLVLMLVLLVLFVIVIPQLLGARS